MSKGHVRCVTSGDYRHEWTPGRVRGLKKSKNFGKVKESKVAEVAATLGMSKEEVKRYINRLT